MTVELHEWGGSDATAPDTRDRFERCGADVRAAWGRTAAQAPEYLDLILRVAGPECLLLIVSSDGRDVARALLARHPAQDSVGAIGFFEAAKGADGEEGTLLVVGRAGLWAAESGLTELYAPVDVSTWFSYRFLVPDRAGQSAPPLFAWEPDTPADYLERFRSQGFEIAERYESLGLHFPTDGGYTFHEVVRYTARAYDAVIGQGFEVGRIGDGEALDGILEALHPVCMRAFAENPLFAPLPAELFRSLYGGILTRTPDHITYWVRDQVGRPAGFIFAFPDGEHLVVKTVAVAPELRGRGLSVMLLHLVMKEAAELGFTKCISALVRKGNTSEFLSDRHAMPGVERWTREYVLLRQEVSS